MEVIAELFIPTTQVLQVDFWRVNSWKAYVELPAVRRNSAGGRPASCLPPRWTLRRGAALCWFIKSEKPLQHIWLLAGVRDADCAVGKSAGKPGGSWVPVFLSGPPLPTSSCGLQAASPLCQHTVFPLWFWPGNKPCFSNWVGFIGPKNTAVSPS